MAGTITAEDVADALLLLTPDELKFSLEMWLEFDRPGNLGDLWARASSWLLFDAPRLARLRAIYGRAGGRGNRGGGGALRERGRQKGIRGRAAMGRGADQPRR